MADQRQKKADVRSRNEITIRRFVFRCGLGIGIGIAVTAMLLMLFAIITSGCGVPVAALQTIGAICGILGAGLAGLFSGLLVGKMGLPVGLCSGVIWVILLFGLRLVLSIDPMASTTVIKAVLGMISSTIGGMCGASAMRRKEKGRYMY